MSGPSAGRGTARAHDGHPLAVTRFPAAGEAWATMVVGCAMGVEQGVYGAFARYLARHGVHVLTFDYRGIGASVAGPLRRVDADVMTWATQDFDAMLLEAAAMAPSLPLTALGHSLGGQLLGVLPHRARVRAAVTVTAGSGWYSFNDRIPVQVRLLWFVLVPVLTTLFGYFPGRRLRMVGDLPRGVVMQWRRWCLHREYLLSEGPAARAAFDSVRFPMLAWSFEDDALLTKAAIEALHAEYRNAPVERRHVAPEAVGMGRIGHFGFFSSRSEAALWRPTLDWLRARVNAGSVRCDPSSTATP